MIGIDRCKELLGEAHMPDSEVIRLREALYTMVESILDDYFEEFVTMDICQKPSSIAESPQQNRASKGMGLIAKSIVAENMQSKEDTML